MPETAAQNGTKYMETLVFQATKRCPWDSIGAVAWAQGYNTAGFQILTETGSFYEVEFWASLEKPQLCPFGLLLSLWKRKKVLWVHENSLSEEPPAHSGRSINCKVVICIWYIGLNWWVRAEKFWLNWKIKLSTKGFVASLIKDFQFYTLGYILKNFLGIHFQFFKLKIIVRTTFFVRLFQSEVNTENLFPISLTLL